MEDLECSICNEEFSENHDRQPRTLSCGHTFCTSCLKTIFSNSYIRKKTEKIYSCPICKTDFRPCELSKIPVSFTILNIVIELKKQQLKKRTSLSQGMLQAMGYCDPHSSPKQFYCSKCADWLCGACVVLNHNKDNDCDIKTVEQMINSKKSINEETLERAKVTHEEIVESISNAISVCETSKYLLRYDVASLKNRIKYAMAEIKSFEAIHKRMRLLYSSVNNEWSTYSTLSEEIEQARDYTQLETASEKVQNLPASYSHKEFYVQFQPKTWTKQLLLEVS